jgi:hypothetical protein
MAQTQLRTPLHVRNSVRSSDFLQRLDQLEVRRSKFKERIQLRRDTSVYFLYQNSANLTLLERGGKIDVACSISISRERERETSIVSRDSGLTALPGEVKQNVSSCAGRDRPKIISRMKMEGFHYPVQN